MTNRPAPGSPALTDPLSTTILTPSITFGGVPATMVPFSGLAPFFAGLYQVNVQIPDGAPTGSTVPVVLSIAGVNSNTVNMAVQ